MVRPVIVDVREPYEFASGHVKGALNIPPADLMTGAEALRGVPKNAEIVLYCRTGSRSNVAMHILQSLGYTNLTNGINQGHVESNWPEANS
jgi:phage shock protein E